MLIRLLSFFTVVSVFGLLPSFGHGRPVCSEVFAESLESVPDSIKSQLFRLDHSLRELRTELKANKHQENRLKVLENLSDDPREISYILQGAYRLLLAHPQAKELFSAADHKALEKGLKEMKRLEKNLGGYQVQRDLYRTAKKNKAPADFLEFLKNKRNQASEATLANLKEQDYINKEISGIQKHLQKLENWQSALGPKAKYLIQESLQNEFYRVREKVQFEMKPLILKPQYEAHELEEGAHAFRRSLRWLKVYILAYQAYLPAKIMTTTEYQLLNESIEGLRKIKKTGEMREKMTLALEEFGNWGGRPLREGEAFQIIDSLMEKKFENIEIRTQEILKLYEDHHGFTGILKEAS